MSTEKGLKTKDKHREAAGAKHLTILPPCQVCGIQATGYHYGANTCEACKAFFRRTLKKKDLKFPCICPELGKKGNLNASQQKTLCPSCRYKRCLEVGMSKDAVKIGRYTLSWKSRNIQEVNRLEEQKQSLPSNQEPSPMIITPLTPPQSEVSDSSSPESDHDRHSTPLIIPGIKKCTCLVKCPVHSMFALTRPDDTDSALVDPSITELEAMVQNLCLAQENMVDPCGAPADLEESEQKKKEYQAEYEMRKDVFGEMNQLSYEEFTAFYNQTGIDIDNRIELLRTKVALMEVLLTDVVTLAKTIPGFQDLTLKDKQTLIKKSRFQSAMLRSYTKFDPTVKVMRCFGKDRFIHIDEIKKFFSEEYLVAKLKTWKQFMDLRLTKEETAVLKGIVIMYSDQCELERPEQCEEIQYRLIQCLQHVIQTQRGPDTTRLATILTSLKDLRDFTDLEGRELRNLVMAYPMLQEYAVVRELIL